MDKIQNMERQAINPKFFVLSFRIKPLENVFS